MEGKPLFEPAKITFEEGFTGKAILGGLFAGFIMMPGSIYLGLLAGQSLGPAAQWVTVVLFTELARRSFTTLRKQEIFILLYITGGLASTYGSLALSGGSFALLIWNQYLVRSPEAAAFGITNKIPTFVVPRPGTADFEAIIKRTFLHHGWLVPIGLLLIGEILGRMNWIGLGYTMFRVTSDIERLPFPLAPIHAEGAMALAEVFQEEETWRWRIFSMGAMIGMVWGLVYAALPIITGVYLAKPISLPIPFIDTTLETERFLPAAITGLSTDLGVFLIGFILPFPAVAGAFISSVIVQYICNPLLYKHGIIKLWHPGLPTIQTHIYTQFDFWMSVGIGANVAIGLTGIYAVVQAFRGLRGAPAGREARKPPAGRGDFPIPIAIGLWFASTVGYFFICRKLIPDFPVMWILFFGFFWTPFATYVSARMHGVLGTGWDLPYLRQATVMLSRYQKIDVWFAPLPMFNQGGWAQGFRTCELVGCKITSIFKAEAFMLPIMLLCSFLFWSFFWRVSPIPSSLYPYAQKMWPLEATMTSMWSTINLPDSQTTWLLEAIKFPLIYKGIAGSLLVYIILSVFRVSPLWFFGLAGGIGAFPHNTIPQFAGALISRYYLSKRVGTERWRAYIPVLIAGFGCGLGLIGMVATALAFVKRAISPLPF